MLKNYFLIAFRNLMRNKLLSMLNIVGLTVGLACCLVILLYIQNAFLYDTHHEKAARIYQVLREYPDNRGDLVFGRGTPGPVGEHIQRDFPEVEMGIRSFVRGMWIIHETKRVRNKVCIADAAFLDVFDYPLIEGDPNSFKTPNTAFISAELSRRLFGDTSPIGKTVSIEYKWEMEADYTITGVMAPIPRTSLDDLKFGFLTSTPPAGSYFEKQVWSNWGNPHGAIPFRTYVLLEPNASAEALRGKMTDYLFKKTGEEASKGTSYHLQALTRAYLYTKQDFGIQHAAFGNIQEIYRQALVGIFILVIACVNFMNLNTARSLKRAREVGMRKVVGANRGQLIQQFLGESTLTAIVALCFALALTGLGLPFVNTFLQVELVPKTTPTLFAGICFLVVSVGLVAGIYPAFILSAFQPIAVLKGSLLMQSKRTWLRRCLVTFQFTISIVLIVSTIVVYQQTQYLHTKDVGYARENVVILPFFRENTALRQKIETVKQSILQHPNILSVSASFDPPGRGNDIDSRPYRSEAGVEIQMLGLGIDHDFFDTYEIPIIQGTNFTQPDGQVILTELAVKRLGLENPIGQTIMSSSGYTPTIVGVAKNFHHRNLYGPLSPVVLHRSDYASYVNVRMRPENTIETLAFLEAQWQQFVPYKPFNFIFLNDFYDLFYYRNEMKLRQVYMVLSGLAIFVTCLGLFGLIAYSAEQRTKEIGIRKILGASEPHIVMLLCREVFVLVAVANLIAWPIAYFAMSNYVQNFAYHITLHPGSFLLGGMITLTIALMTVASQTIKSARANPITALRYE